MKSVMGKALGLKEYALSVLFLFFLSFSATGPVFAASNASSGNDTGIPTQLVSYLANLPSTHPAIGCVDGTVSPFTISSTTCNTLANGPTGTLSTSCSTDCTNGGYTTWNTGYYSYSGLFYAPSDPTVSPSYSSPTAFYDYIGLQPCWSGCGSYNYLLQAGEVWGEDSTYSSSNPTVFEEFVETGAGGCTTWNSNCAQLGTWTVSHNDALDVSISYTSGVWSLYVQDSTVSKYQLMYVTAGSGTYDYPYADGVLGDALSEGQGTTASNQIPGGVSMYDLYGTGATGNVLGSNTQANTPTTGSQSVSLSYSSGTCSWGSGTCGDQMTSVS
jgi:hypothetical protein